MEPHAKSFSDVQKPSIYGSTGLSAADPPEDGKKKSAGSPISSYPSDSPTFPQVSSISELWSEQTMLHAQVFEVNEQTVSCDCIIDEEMQLMEKRSFPRIIFDTLPNLHEGSLVIVDIKQKAGSIRIDIKNGKGIVNPQKFELESLIDSLKDF